MRTHIVVQKCEDGYGYCYPIYDEAINAEIEKYDSEQYGEGDIYGLATAAVKRLRGPDRVGQRLQLWTDEIECIATYYLDPEPAPEPAVTPQAWMVGKPPEVLPSTAEGKPYAVYYDNGSGYFDCGSVHATAAEALAAASPGDIVIDGAGCPIIR